MRRNKAIAAILAGTWRPRRRRRTDPRQGELKLDGSEAKDV
jgi:hypothetical protein